MTLNVFDPQKHKIVAIISDGPEKGSHLHVSLLELAMDMSKVDFAPFFERMAALESAARSVEVPVSVDLAPVLDRLAALEQKDLLTPVLEKLAEMTSRISALEERTPEPHGTFDAKPLISAIDEKFIASECAAQVVVTVMDELSARVSKLESRVGAIEETTIPVLVSKVA